MNAIPQFQVCACLSSLIPTTWIIQKYLKMNICDREMELIVMQGLSTTLFKIDDWLRAISTITCPRPWYLFLAHTSCHVYHFNTMFWTIHQVWWWCLKLFNNFKLSSHKAYCNRITTITPVYDWTYTSEWHRTRTTAIMKKYSCKTRHLLKIRGPSQ